MNEHQAAQLLRDMGEVKAHVSRIPSIDERLREVEKRQAGDRVKIGGLSAFVSMVVSALVYKFGG